MLTSSVQIFYKKIRNRINKVVHKVSSNTPASPELKENAPQAVQLKDSIEEEKGEERGEGVKILPPTDLICFPSHTQRVSVRERRREKEKEEGEKKEEER